jgi:hypothetical protein
MALWCQFSSLHTSTLHLSEQLYSFPRRQAHKDPESSRLVQASRDHLPAIAELLKEHVAETFELNVVTQQNLEELIGMVETQTPFVIL